MDQYALGVYHEGQRGEADQQSVMSITVNKISFQKKGLCLKKKCVKDIAREISSDSFSSSIQKCNLFFVASYREAWRAAIHGVAESDMTERLNELN